MLSPMKKALAGLCLLHLDFRVAAGREAEIHQRVDCLWSRVQYIDQAFVYAHLELFAAFLIDVRALYYSKSTAPRWQRYRTGDSDAREFTNIHDHLVGNPQRTDDPCKHGHPQCTLPYAVPRRQEG